MLHFLKHELVIWGIEETLVPTMKLFPLGYIKKPYIHETNTFTRRELTFSNINQINLNHTTSRDLISYVFVFLELACSNTLLVQTLQNKGQSQTKW